MLMASLTGSSIMLALPVIFRGIGINPLDPGSSAYLLWLLMGFTLVVAVLVVTAGRLGDIFGRTRMYNLGFAIFTLGAILCSSVWSTGPAGAIELIIFRVVQGIGSAFLWSNSAAILVDAFPETQRGMALGINMVAGTFGSFLGILVGGLLSQVGWRWVFIINIPISLALTIWAFLSLKEVGTRTRQPIDWLGNITFAAGLTMMLIGLIYGTNPGTTSATSWATPFVLSMLIGGAVLLAVFAFIEVHVSTPMFRLELFRIRAFAAGNLAGFLGSMARGGLMLMLTIWLQGIWLPLHGYNFEITPLWAGIYMIPSSIGMLITGPLSGRLSDRFGARYFATIAMLLTAVGFTLMLALPVNFSYPFFALVILLDGMAMGMFISPNTAAIMNSLPEQYRGAGSGMRSTLINIGNPLSMAIIFSLMIFGLNALVPTEMYNGLIQHGIPMDIAQKLASAPPVGYLFASLLGYNPLGTLIPSNILQSLPQGQASIITSREFFPQLIDGAFHHGLIEVLIFSIIMCLIAAGASWLRGGKYVYREKIKSN